MTIWMDMTNSLVTYSGGVVGIIRAELMLAKMLHKIDNNIKYSILTEYGFKEVTAKELQWLWDSSNLSDSYKKYQTQKKLFINKINKELIRFKEKNEFKIKRHNYKKESFDASNFIVHPYENEDTIYSCGWLGTKKEEKFTQLKAFLPNINLVYTIYDLAMLNKNLATFYTFAEEPFKNYLNWISSNCDSVIYGGKTAQLDAEEYFRKNNLTVPRGNWIKWGDNIETETQNHTLKNKNDKDILNKLNINSSYILAVGSIDYKKNYRILYQAFCQLALRNSEYIPQLIIVGRKLGDTLEELNNAMLNNPLTKDKIKIINCTDEELDVLYRNCQFSVLPTLYEGWSLTLPESLRYGKLCLCSDIAPLREVGGDLPIYINPKYPKEWADKIEFYLKNPKELIELENKIKANWCSISWEESANKLRSFLLESPIKDIVNQNILNNKISDKNKNTIYYCLNLLLYNGPITGITRAQMLIARYLYKIRDDINFFIIRNNKFCILSPENISNILSDSEIEKATMLDRKRNTNFIFENIPFSNKNIILDTGFGHDSKTYKTLIELQKTTHFDFCQLIYDFTPITVPHTHTQKTVAYFDKFLNMTFNLSSYILYGGKTAMNDGINYQKQHGYETKHSYPIKFGSNIVTRELNDQRKNNTFNKYGINDNFILTVGTIEARKNHETLYEAYIELLERNIENLPQLVICGNPGWRTKEFQKLIKADKRIKDKVIMITPSDDELDVLYQTCKFTLLASFYEGWSLTLPESLNYNKFCIASDTPSLKEIGKDIIDYANPYDPIEWADKIEFYLKNPKELANRETLIKAKWENTTWEQCAKNISNILDEILIRKGVE